MTVEMIAYTRPDDHDNPAAVVEQAACICYNSTPDLVGFKVARACARSGHLSVWEHISFTFKVTGVSRALLAQLTRHRHASYSVRSQRYCAEDGFEIFNPFEAKGINHRRVDELAQDARDCYQLLTASGAAPEDARYVLPNACTTQLYVTANARALIEASHLRLCSRAQAEIRQLFAAMRDQVGAVCPELAALMVPQCEQHAVPFCPERQSCGRHPRLQDLIK